MTFEGNTLAAIDYLFSEPQYLLYAFPLSLHPIDFFVSLFIVGFVVFVIQDKKRIKRSTKRCGTWLSTVGNVEKDLKDMYDEEDQYNNIIFSQNTKLRLDDKEAPPKVRRNKNVVVIGGSGSGKRDSL